MDTLLRLLLELRPHAAETLEAWWPLVQSAHPRYDAPVDRALIGGALADRLGFAFVAGYQAALHKLVGASAGITSLCVTEAGGNRPRDITTRLIETSDGALLIDGRKTWATGGPLASTLLVVATTGTGADGRSKLRVARVPANARGLRITPASTQFVPEIPHAQIELESVAVDEADLLPGDGYASYVKPFRTIEDAHVHAALLGYMINVARRLGVAQDVIEQLLSVALAVRTVAMSAPDQPSTHIALAGTLTQIAHLIGEIELRWEVDEGPEWERWQRDRVLLRVAGTARVARRKKAWSVFESLL